MVSFWLHRFFYTTSRYYTHMDGSTVLHQLSRLCGLSTWEVAVLPFPTIFAALLVATLTTGAEGRRFWTRP